MCVFAREAERHFFGVGFANERRSSVEQLLRNRRCVLRGFVRVEPIGTAKTGFVSGDVVDVFKAKCESGQRTRWCTIQCHVGVASERTQ